MKAWLVNTNSKEMNKNPNGYKYMLRQNKAATFYDRNGAIDKIKKGDLVLIYHNMNRVIAVGAVVQDPDINAYNNPKTHDFPETHRIEHWVDLNWLWKADFENNEPVNYIDRKDIGITMVNGTVVNITKQLDFEVLFSEICYKQKYL